MNVRKKLIEKLGKLIKYNIIKESYIPTYTYYQLPRQLPHACEFSNLNLNRCYNNCSALFKKCVYSVSCINYVNCQCENDAAIKKNRSYAQS